MTEDIDKPVGHCEKCGADIWKSMLSGNLVKSCNCVKDKNGKDGKAKQSKNNNS